MRRPRRLLGAALGAMIAGCGAQSAEPVNVSVSLTTEPGAWDVVAADMNGDGRIDLVSAETDGKVVIRLNPGGDRPWKEWPRTELSSGATCGRLAVGDVNGDGRMDIVALPGFGDTSSPYLLRTWLSEGSTFTMKQISLEQCPSECAEPCQSGKGKLFLSSVALADVDADGGLDLVVSSYPAGPPATAPLHVLSFDRESRSFKYKPGWSRCGQGATRVRFHDMDGDGRLDMITSFYRFEMSAKGKPVPWGQWWQLGGGAPEPRALTVTLAPSSEVLTVVDFDLSRGTSGKTRFALALSAHHCGTDRCWDEDQVAGGYAVVAEADGKPLWSSKDLEQQERSRRSDGKRSSLRLVPRLVQFTGEAPGAEILVGYWWAKLGDCPDRSRPCPGPFLLGKLPAEKGQPSDGVFTPASMGWFSQGIAPSAFAPGDVQDRRSCYPGSTTLLSLPHATIARITRVSRAGEPVPYQWVPGSREVVLRGPGEGEVCVEYGVATGRRFAVADLSQGIVPLESTSFQR